MGRKPKNAAAKASVSPEDILVSYLKEKEEEHYNFEPEINYKVSTGSLLLDIETGGGLGPGLHRFCGINEGGKTSQSLEIMRNFLTSVENSRAVLFKAEGRLSPEMKNRTGINFCTDASEWQDGTCFVFESNIYETVFDLMKKLIQNSKGTNTKYLFVLDSVDGLQTKGDSEKALEDANKVASGATISSVFMKKVATALNKRGHMAIFISQVRADIQLDPYSKAPMRTTSATGGNALLHFANWILEFQRPLKRDLILEDDKMPPDTKKNKILGHWARVQVKKSPNEKTNYTLTYPVKYGRVNKSSIWSEKEIVEQLIAWEFVSKSGAWFTISTALIDELKMQEIEIPEKVHGESKLFDLLETDTKLTEFLISKFRDLLASIQSES